MGRKVIAVITSCPEEAYQQRLLKGIFEQCAKYGYNVAMFSMNVQTWHYFGEYLAGDENIYNLMDFDKIDGVIVTTITLSNNHQSDLADKILEKLQTSNKSKVVTVDAKLGDYEDVYTDDKAAFKEIANHLIEEHGCKNIYCLTGFENVEVSKIRVDGVKESLAEHGLTIAEEHIFYGDFWYNSGEKLGEDLVNGVYEKPDAVICANDHMATGLIKRLMEGGIRVPEDILITGYDASTEAYLNGVSVTSFEPDVYSAGAKAVDIIHKVIEPDVPLCNIVRPAACGLTLGDSCGCMSNLVDVKKNLNGHINHIHQGYNMVDKNNPFDINRLNESFMFESLLAQNTVKQVLESIDRYTYLIKPFEDFYLCLREDWLDMDSSCTEGYSNQIRMVIHRNVYHETDSRVHSCFSGDDTVGERSFETKEMLPELFQDTDEPCVFYFSPVHFNRETFGYSVLKCKLTDEYIIASVYRNWIRNIGNALEMIRVRARLMDDSIEDELTGLYNRRGMFFKLREEREHNIGKKIYVIMVDMDRLKYINDNFGHEEGDFGIKTISNSINIAASGDNICVRSGGDEFLIIGFGDADDNKIEAMIQEIRDDMSRKAMFAKKPYPITASFGYVTETYTEDLDIEKLIKDADEKMYFEKRQKHAARQ